MHAREANDTRRSQGKKTPFARPGQVKFPLGQVTFSPQLPHGQGPRQDVHQLNSTRVNLGKKNNSVLVDRVAPFARVHCTKNKLVIIVSLTTVEAVREKT